MPLRHSIHTRGYRLRHHNHRLLLLHCCQQLLHQHDLRSQHLLWYLLLDRQRFWRLEPDSGGMWNMLLLPAVLRLDLDQSNGSDGLHKPSDHDHHDHHDHHDDDNDHHHDALSVPGRSLLLRYGVQQRLRSG